MTFLPTIPYDFKNFPPYIIYYIYNFLVCIYVYIDIWIYKYIDVLIDGCMSTTGAQAGLLFVSVLWFCLVFYGSVCGLIACFCFGLYGVFILLFALVWLCLWLLIALFCLPVYCVFLYIRIDENMLFYISIYVCLA